MATFNVDSLDFVDDEEARFGAGADYSARYSSSNSRLELEDLTNATVGYVPQNVGTDLVGGKFAETVSEGKALADDGNVYDSIQRAQNAATSWVKVGPGRFNESVTIGTAGLTLEGSGNRTTIKGISVSASNVTVQTLLLQESGGNSLLSINSGDNITINNVEFDGEYRGVSVQEVGSNNITISNCNIDTDGDCVVLATTTGATGGIVVNNKLNSEEKGVYCDYGDSIIANNTITVTTFNAIQFGTSAVDNITIANSIFSSSDTPGIRASGTEQIIANNRLVGSAVNNDGTGNVLDANLIT